MVHLHVVLFPSKKRIDVLFEQWDTYFSSWWFQPISVLVKLDHFPKFRGKNKKYVKVHHPVFVAPPKKWRKTWEFTRACLGSRTFNCPSEPEIQVRKRQQVTFSRWKNGDIPISRNKKWWRLPACTRMSQEVSKWLGNGLQPTYKWSILGL